jgi:hypothetical protein
LEKEKPLRSLKMVDFYSIFHTLEGSGFYEYVLPFLLVFVVLFAILEKTLILGSTGPKGEQKPKTNLNVILAVVLALVILINTELIFIMNQYLSRMAFFIVLGVMFMLVIAMFAGKDAQGKFFSGLNVWVAGAIAVVALLWSLSSSGYGWSFLPYWITDEVLSWILFLAIFGIIIAVLTKENRSPSTGREAVLLRSA